MAFSAENVDEGSVQRYARLENRNDPSSARGLDLTVEARVSIGILTRDADAMACKRSRGLWEEVGYARIQVNLCGFPRQRATGSVVDPRRRKVSRAGAASDGQPAGKGRGLFLLRRLCPSPDRHRPRRRQEPRGAEG